MAARLHVAYKNPSRKDEFYAVSTQEVFHTYWLPECKRLNLNWLPLIADVGINLLEQIEDMPTIQNEFEVLRDYLLNSDTLIPKERREDGVSRIEQILLVLRTVQEAPDTFRGVHIG
jgi:hypothetical protein